MKNILQSKFLLVEAISAEYSKHSSVIENISFNLEQGELACLLGPSGCGKTTILNAISGFQNITSGEIFLDGIRLSQPNKLIEPENRSVGMVFQDHSLFPHLTICENIAFGLKNEPQSKRDEIISTMLELIGMTDHASKYPHELSGGQSQRVALARAIAPKPKLLLMDEPFSNLDAELRESLGYEVRAMLKELNITAIMVTHDQNDAFALGDQIGIISKGKLLQWDNSFNLYHMPNSRFVANFIGDGVFIKGEIIKDNVIATRLGEIKGQFINANNLDKNVDLLLRPDHVKYDSKSPVRGQIIRKAFKGEKNLYTLNTKEGDKLMSLVPSHHDFEIGETMGVKIELDNLICFEQQYANPI